MYKYLHKGDNAYGDDDDNNKFHPELIKIFEYKRNSFLFRKGGHI